jgi:uncharacterized protein YbjT (DUF2867 family)
VSESLERVYVFGASGLVGGELLDLLLRETEAAVTSWGRRGTGVRHPRLEERIGDPASWVTAQTPSADTAFCALGTTLRRAGSRAAFRAVDHDLVVEAARLARRAGARHFLLVSALGADPESRVFYNRVKGDAEASVRGTGFEAVTVLRPSLLLGERAESRPAEAVAGALAGLASPLLRGPLRRYRPVRARVVARAMLRAAGESTGGCRVIEAEEVARLGAG